MILFVRLLSQRSCNILSLKILFLRINHTNLKIKRNEIHKILYSLFNNFPGL